MLCFALIMAMGISRELSTIFFIVLPILAAGLFYIVIKGHPYFEAVFKRYDVLNRVVQENLNAIRVVKAYVREPYEIEKFRHISQEVFYQFKYAEKIVAWNSPLMQFCMYNCILLVSGLGARLIVGSRMTTGELTSMIIYAVQILSSLMMLSMVFVMVIMARSSAERIVEVLDEKSSLSDPDDPVQEVADGSIDFEHVSFSYIGDKEKLALKDVDIHIKSGETIGILGGTGSSKTTLVQLIPRLYDVTGGCLKVGGRDVKEYGLKSLRNQVAVVLQKNVLFSGTILENSAAPSVKTCGGAMKMPQTGKSSGPAVWPRQTSLSGSFPTSMKPISTREEPMYPGDRSRGSVLPGPCSRSLRY